MLTTTRQILQQGNLNTSLISHHFQSGLRRTHTIFRYPSTHLSFLFRGPFVFTCILHNDVAYTLRPVPSLPFFPQLNERSYNTQSANTRHNLNTYTSRPDYRSIQIVTAPFHDTCLHQKALRILASSSSLLTSTTQSPIRTLRIPFLSRHQSCHLEITTSIIRRLTHASKFGEPCRTQPSFSCQHLEPCRIKVLVCGRGGRWRGKANRKEGSERRRHRHRGCWTTMIFSRSEALGS